MKTNKQTQKKGFTIIEVIVVIAIIATLGSVIFGAIYGGVALQGEGSSLFEENKINN